MKRRTRNFIKGAAAVLFTAACAISLYAPYPSRFSGGESYECVWADGSVTKESYTSAYSSLAGMDGESIFLSRGGQTGKIDSYAKTAYEILENGDLAGLLECTAEGTRIDCAALYRTFSDRVWYDGSYFIWTGNRIERVAKAKRKEIVFMAGKVTSRTLRETGASTVYLRAGAELETLAFVGSGVNEVYAEEPYSQREGAVYLDTVSGKRLLAAVGDGKELVLDEDMAFADEGALLACRSLVSLSLPFLGNAKSPSGSLFTGELAYLFSDGKEYDVPKTLSRVTVTGGRIVSSAFYACPAIREINVCKVQANEISRTAFAGLSSLEVLHTPNREAVLTGRFTSYTADCGCTVFKRVGEKP